MTPRTIESEFAELLKSQMKDEFPVDMTLEGPLTSLVHPKVLMANLQFQHNPGQEMSYTPIHGWHFEPFRNYTEATLKYPDIELKFEGRPWSVFKFFESGASEAIIDFKELGTAVICKHELPTKPFHELHDHVIQAWLSYALSPELWGHVGKWSRFHQRLHDLLRKKDLLSGEDVPGYYPLKLSLEKLKDFGFIGTNLDKTYLLVLPWTFSLSALNKLEDVIQREF